MSSKRIEVEQILVYLSEKSHCQIDWKITKSLWLQKFAFLSALGSKKQKANRRWIMHFANFFLENFCELKLLDTTLNMPIKKQRPTKVIVLLA